MDMVIGVVIVLVIVAVILYLVNLLPLPVRVKHVARVVVVVAGVLTILRQLGFI